MPGERSAGCGAAGVTALVLAGRRAASDALAEREGVSHRALIPVLGVPMLARVLDTVRSTRGIERVVVSAGDPEVLSATPELRALRDAGAVEHHASRGSPSASVLDFLEHGGAPGPVLATTADHPLLTPRMLQHFLDEALASGADVVVGLVPAQRVLAAWPESRRTVIRLGRDRVCGANLYLFRSARAPRVAAFWSRAERFRKQPWKLVRLFGARALLRAALGRLDLDTAFERASARIGARIAPVSMPFPECAVDVDGPEDLALATRILTGRARAVRTESGAASSG